MTAANESTARVASWIEASSKPRCVPFGDLIPVGRFAVLVPVVLDAPEAMPSMRRRCHCRFRLRRVSA